MNKPESKGYKLYEVSNDNGYSWSQQWLTKEEVNCLVNNFYRVRDCRSGFEIIPDVEFR